MTDASAADKFKFCLNLNKRTGATENDGSKNVEIMIPLKYLSNFWMNHKKPLNNCEVNLILTWSNNCVISNAAANQATKFAINNTNLYVPVVTLSTNGNGKLSQLLKSGFKRIINWNKYQSKTTIQAPNRYLDYLTNPSFQGVNRLFVLTFDVNANRLAHSRYYLATLKLKTLCYD